MSIMRPIATRAYLVQGTDEAYQLEVYTPYPLDRAQRKWQCEIKIRGDRVPEGLDNLSVGGVDSCQALELALEAAKAMIETFSKDHLGSKLRCTSDGNGDQ